MNQAKAKELIRTYGKKSILSEDDEFIYIEALKYMIEETKDPKYMVELGGYYYGEQIYDQALKYYEMADTYGDKWAPNGLGYIWYYGRTGETDYEKAFHYYSKDAKNGYIQAEMKVADMYKNGCYVEKNYKKYCRMIESLMERMKHPKYLNDPFPELCTRLAKIRREEGYYDRSITLYLDAKDFLRQRIRHTFFFGDLNIMKWAMEDLYSLIPFGEEEFDLYDLYWLLKTPHTVSFRYQNRSYEIKAEDAEGSIAVHFNNKWYRTIDDFFNNAAIENEKLIGLDEELYGFKIVK